MITVIAGRGGDGCVSFRREKYVPRGGPDGGDGGRGGSVFITSNPNLFSLENLHNKATYKATSAQAGGRKKRHGRNGENVVLEVPVGTVVLDDETGEQIAELMEKGEKRLVAAGGTGGRGNVHFATPQNRVPQIAETGHDGELRRLRVVLNLIADVALVGIPGAGKSSLLAALTNAKPRIGDWSFTTRRPMIGVHRINEYASFRMMDLPGLIEGSHRKQGVGNAFLKHLSRPPILLFVLAPDLEISVAEQEKMLRAELEQYDAAVLEKQILRVYSKVDLGKPKAREKKAGLLVSAETGEGLPELSAALAKKLKLEDDLASDRKPGKKKTE